MRLDPSRLLLHRSEEISESKKEEPGVARNDSYGVTGVPWGPFSALQS